MARLFILLVLLYSLAVNARRGKDEEVKKGTDEPVWKKQMEEYHPRNYLKSFDFKFVKKILSGIPQPRNREEKDAIKGENSDIKKTILGIHEKKQNMIKMKDALSKFGKDTEETKKQDVKEVEKVVKESPEAKKVVSSWGKIFGVFGRAIRDFAINTESEEEKGGEVEDSRRRRRSVVETVEVYEFGNDTAPVRETRKNENAEQGKLLGEHVGKYFHKKGQQLLEYLAQNMKDAVNTSSSDMAEKLKSDVQKKFQEPVVKKLKTQIPKKVTDALAEENKTWDWMKVIRAVVEEIVNEDSEEPKERPL